MSTEYQQRLRERFRAAPPVPPPDPWRFLGEVPIGGLLGVGFAPHPDTGSDLILVASSQGRGVFDCADLTRLARDPDPEPAWPEGPDLTCPGIGPLAGTDVPVAGLLGGGLHYTAESGWTLTVVAPDWPTERVILARAGADIHRRDAPGTTWWTVHVEDMCELRAVGFSPSGDTLVIASSCSLHLFTAR